MTEPILIVIAGPTASGKTELAAEMARSLETSVINADSRQVYQVLNIGVAKPNAAELAMAPHHMIDVIPPEQHFNAGDYAAQVRQLLQKLFDHKQVVVLSGGTGLYIQALLEGLDELPEIPEQVRLNLAEELRISGLDSMVQKLLQLSPDAANLTDLKNPARVLRALELVTVSGKPLGDIRKGSGQKQPWRVLGYYLNPDRDWLYERINQRTELMMEAGLLEEANSLFPLRHLKALQTVGYTELFQHIEGKLTLAEAVSLIKQHTRNYAKRQLTWFRNRTDFKAISPQTARNTIFADLEQYGFSNHQ